MARWETYCLLSEITMCIFSGASYRLYTIFIQAIVKGIMEVLGFKGFNADT